MARGYQTLTITTSTASTTAMNTPLPPPLDPERPKRRRNRAIQSCFACRTRKLRCDRGRPSCGTCSQTGQKCEYLTGIKLVDKSSDEDVPHQLTDKIEFLEKEVARLKNKRAEVLKKVSTSDEGPILLGHALSLFSPIRRDPFLNKLLETYKTKSMKSPPREIKEEFETLIYTVGRLDLLKLQLKKENKQLSDMIKIHIADMENVWFLVNKFFESELYGVWFFLDKDDFYRRLASFSLVKDVYDEADYLFVGKVLIIMRITYLSFYNCGYNQQEFRSLKPVDPDVFYLAKLCLDHTIQSMQDMSIPYIQLLLLVIVYQTFTPDDFSAIHDWVMSDLNRLVRLCYIGQLNVDKGGDEIERKIWFQVLELDLMRFLYDGTPLSITTESYTTQLPTTQFSQTVKERTSVHDLVSPISQRLNNARDPPTARNYEIQIDAMLKFTRECNLEVIMAMPSTTVEERVIKLNKFNNFIDLSSLCSMLCTHLLIHFFEKGDTLNAHKLTAKVVRCLNNLAPLAYFLDPDNNHAYNLHLHFGLTFNLIPKITQVLHRCFQIHYSLLLRVWYLQSRGYDVDDIAAVLLTNTEIILTNVGKIGDMYSFARRLYRFGSDSVTSIVGSSSSSAVRANLIDFLRMDQSLRVPPDTQVFLPHELRAHLVILTGNIKLATTTTDMNLFDMYLEHGLDPFSVQKIESLLFSV